MNSTVIAVLEAVMLVSALSMDAFVASFAYGTNKIKIPFRSVAVISVICSSILAAALLLGGAVRSVIPPYLTGIICFIILFLLGIVKLCDSTVKSLIRKKKNMHKELAFSLLHLNFILNIYADPEEADSDMSKILSPGEAASLAVALSLDGLAVGFGAALAKVNPVQIVGISLVTSIIAVMSGCFVGNKIAEKVSLNLSWLSGVMLMILALLKL